MPGQYLVWVWRVSNFHISNCPLCVSWTPFDSPRTEDCLQRVGKQHCPWSWCSVLVVQSSPLNSNPFPPGLLQTVQVFFTLWRCECVFKVKDEFCGFREKFELKSPGGHCSTAPLNWTEPRRLGQNADSTCVHWLVHVLGASNTKKAEAQGRALAIGEKRIFRKQKTILRSGRSCSARTLPPSVRRRCDSAMATQQLI